MPRKTCPPEHIEYLSQMLAINAATLHTFIHPDCPGIEWFGCGDHFHIGHPPGNKAECPPGIRPLFPNVRGVRKPRSKRV